jgi:cyclase
MFRSRVIPALLLKNRGLVKTVKFKDPKYLGDPINIVRIFNDKEVDELVFLDITATPEKRRPSFDLLANITGECFMPLAYGGGIRDMDDIKTLFKLGIEKIILNTAAVESPELITRAAEQGGSQAVVISVDVRKGFLGRYEVFTHGGQKATGLAPVEFALEMEKRGAGELFLNSIDRDGTMQGYDIPLIKSVTQAVSIPVIACGGAHNLDDFSQAVKSGGASAVAAGSMFVFHGKHRAVLISYPTREEIERVLN